MIAAMPSNSWKMLPNTMMKDVCPLPYNAYACEMVIAAWSGGAYDVSRDRMVVFGGGHADSWYNNLFAFDLGQMKWTRLSEMGAGSTGDQPNPAWRDSRLESCGFYPKGPVSLPQSVMNASGTQVEYSACFTEPVLSQLDLQQPRSSHTYGAVFVDLQGRYCSIGETYFINAGGSPVSICFDPVTAKWSRIADRPQGIGGRGQTAVAANGHVWSLAGENGYIGEYNPSTNAWTRYGYNNYDAGGGTDIDRRRNQLYTLFSNEDGTHSLHRWDLNSPASLNAVRTYSVTATTGTAPTGMGMRPGFAYADALDKFYAWGGGQTVYSYNPETSTWTRLTPSGDVPAAQSTWGTYGRFRYSAARKVFVLVNSTTQNVHIYKP